MRLWLCTRLLRADDDLDEYTKSNIIIIIIEVRPNLDKYLNGVQEYKAELKYSKLTNVEKKLYKGYKWF